LAIIYTDEKMRLNKQRSNEERMSESLSSSSSNSREEEEEEDEEQEKEELSTRANSPQMVSVGEDRIESQSIPSSDILEQAIAETLVSPTSSQQPASLLLPRKRSSENLNEQSVRKNSKTLMVTPKAKRPNILNGIFKTPKVTPAMRVGKGPGRPPGSTNRQVILKI
jgi:hypothetical protein